MFNVMKIRGRKIFDKYFRVRTISYRTEDK